MPDKGAIEMPRSINQIWPCFSRQQTVCEWKRITTLNGSAAVWVTNVLHPHATGTHTLRLSNRDRLISGGELTDVSMQTRPLRRPPLSRNWRCDLLCRAVQRRQLPSEKLRGESCSLVGQVAREHQVAGA